MKKFLLGMSTVLVLGALTVGWVGSGQAQVGKQYVGNNSLFTWDPVALNADGTPCVDLAGYRVGIFPVALPLGAPTATVMVDGAVTSQPAAPLLVGILQGTPMRIAVQAYDLAGNPSAWSESVELTVDTVPPAPPSKPGCAILK